MAASKPKKEVFEKTRGAFGKKGSLRRAFFAVYRRACKFCNLFYLCGRAKGTGVFGIGGAKWFYGNKTPNRNFLPVKKLGAVKPGCGRVEEAKVQLAGNLAIEVIAGYESLQAELVKQSGGG